ncbi:MAG: hypothetical protein AABZ60_16680, partial [Planctomycetota bacterium]
MKQKWILCVVLFGAIFLSNGVQAQKEKKEPAPADWLDRPDFNWKYRDWGNYINGRYGIQWNLGSIASTISQFWKITNYYKKGTVSVLKMTHHSWTLDLDAYPGNANVTGQGGQVIYAQGQTP